MMFPILWRKSILKPSYAIKLMKNTFSFLNIKCCSLLSPNVCPHKMQKKKY